MDKIDERERRFSFAAAGLAAVFGIAVYVAETSNPHFRLAKNQLTPQTTLVLGLGAAALLLITTFIGRRALIGFVALFTFLAFGTQYFLGVPFLALAIWLLYRSFKIQRETSAAARATPTESPSGRATTAGSSGKPTPASRGSRSKSKAMPEGNKRYTPKTTSAPSTEAIAARAEGVPVEGVSRAQVGSASSAERNSSRISARRRTSERAVGSSPNARKTSTSVTIPMTVE